MFGRDIARISVGNGTSRLGRVGAGQGTRHSGIESATRMADGANDWIQIQSTEPPPLGTGLFDGPFMIGFRVQEENERKFRLTSNLLSVSRPSVMAWIAGQERSIGPVGNGKGNFDDAS